VLQVSVASQAKHVELVAFVFAFGAGDADSA
jgi:hypothetical protein